MRKTKSFLSVTLMAVFLLSLTSVALAAGQMTMADPQPMPNKDIVQTAVDAGSFKTLAAALKAADLVDLLKGPGPFTVFAPTDDAFAKLPPGTLDNLLKPENKAQLVSILTYHVVAAKFPAASVMVVKDFISAQGQPLAVSTMNGKVTIENATVTAVDIMAKNGVIHVIDTVLLPK